MVNILAVQEEQREELRQFNIERRIMRNESDPFQLGDNHFNKPFRLTKDMTHYVLNRILPTISTKTSVLAIQPSTIFFCTIFLCNWVISKNSLIIYLSQQFVSRAIMEVTSAIVTVLGQEWIRFPTTVEEKNC
ncbi:hypothetical protein NQ314_019951 [Rhamnusium bicolor]|uniref:Uncharacterized protein n=1 Tax=Rhamnusium bicolor TaxID=1586634 RepID=A0AAV8WMC3_9CUCU|nr:hypothetical protein NQ314_019951 [Rhamnusium bicolor]